MRKKDLLESLFISSTLRDDLLLEVKSVVYDLINNVKLDDEVMARVSDKTYEFIKELKQ